MEERNIQKADRRTVGQTDRRTDSLADWLTHRQVEWKKVSNEKKTSTTVIWFWDIFIHSGFAKKQTKHFPEKQRKHLLLPLYWYFYIHSIHFLQWGFCTRCHSTHVIYTMGLFFGHNNIQRMFLCCWDTSSPLLKNKHKRRMSYTVWTLIEKLS